MKRLGLILVFHVQEKQFQNKLCAEYQKKNLQNKAKPPQNVWSMCKGATG